MMRLETETKQKLFIEHGFKKEKTDTGSPESQIALLTYRINHLTEHLAMQKKDYSAQTGLLKLVGRRKKMLSYLKESNIDRYRAILADLKLRK